MKLTGKKALITGGNSGIGLATARLFVAEGAEIAITGRDQKTLDEAVAELGPNARGYRADVTVADDRKRLFADLAKDFGKLDIVFANAGISGRTPTGATDEAAFENIVHTNLNGAFFTINSAAPLLNDNASIIFNGSVHNYWARPAWRPMRPRRAGSSLWRVRSPPTLRRATFASMSSHPERPKLPSGSAGLAPRSRQNSPPSWLISTPRRFPWVDGANLKNSRRRCFSWLPRIRRTSMRSN